MKRRRLLTLFLIFSSITILFVPVSEALAIGPFGGQIGVLFFCLYGVIEITLGPPTPGLYMYGPGSFSYLHGPPTHPGQWLLGMSAPPVPCLDISDGNIFTRSTGGFIIFHGSSI